MREYKRTQMTPISETPVLCHVVLFADNATELALEPLCNLVENEQSRMYI